MSVGQREHWPSLDGLRGLAIVLVVASHSASFIGPTGGQIGVTLFFVLSGFLITHILLWGEERKGRIRLKEFYARRVRRLLPALFAFLAVSATAYLIFRSRAAAWESTWPPLAYVTNYAKLAGVNVRTNQHLWSLAVEEHFYMLWPVALVAIPALRRPRVVLAGVGLLILWRFFAANVNTLWSYLGSGTNAYAIGLGCFLALLRAKGVRWAPPKGFLELMAAVLVVLSLWPVASFATDGYQVLSSLGIWLPVVAAFVAGFAVWSGVEGSSVFFESRAMRWLGRVSYGWYLWHAPLLFLPIFNGTLLSRLTIAVGSLLVAALSWRFLEQPILNRKPLRKSRESQRTQSTTV